MSVMLLASFDQSEPPAGSRMAATYNNGVLHVTIPHAGLHAGTGELTVEVLDPEDRVIARTVRRVQAREGAWVQALQLSTPLAVEDLVWHRLQYRFSYRTSDTPAMEGIEAISNILRTPVVHVLGQSSYLTGGTAVERVIVTDENHEPITGAGTVRVELLSTGKTRQFLFDGRLNKEGTAQVSFVLPKDAAGNGALQFMVDTPLGSAEFTQNVVVEKDKAAILLTTEKPVYQPGQTIHVRALALNRSAHEPVTQSKLIFELEDSRGNKVFRKITQTSDYGIAAAEFGLADEVNLGTYHLRAIMEDNTAEVALNVDRYVLPKFKVAVELTGNDGKTKRGYRPGDHVTGTVHANYFFGKPVDGSSVTVKASAMDVSLVDAGASEGKTDSEGSYHFDIKLPNYFAGKALSQGAARVLIEATVKDGAGHSETKGEPVIVSDSPILITAVPESGSLIAGLTNQVFLLASYPDGTPAKVEFKANLTGAQTQTVSSDAGGMGVLAVKIGNRENVLEVTASDQEGQRSSKSIALDMKTGDAQVLLRSERAIYRVGEYMRAKVLSTKQSGAAYVDVIQDGHTIETRDLDLINGEANFAFVATPDLAGTLEWNAYIFGEDGRPVADRRLLFVQPPDELKIETSVDAPVHRPGDDARIDFRVTNNKGQGVQAALGLQIVDEAVFALAEKQPGFAKVFFYLEQELMKPRYEIHSIGLPEAITSVDPTEANRQDRAAHLLFAATQLIRRNSYEAEFGRNLDRPKSIEYLSRYRAHFNGEVSRLAELVSNDFAERTADLDSPSSFKEWENKHAAQLRDAWGRPFTIEPTRGNWGFHGFTVQSAGPDGRFHTQDDLVGYLRYDKKSEIHIEHDRGPAHGMAQVVGTVSDMEGYKMSNAEVTLHEKQNDKTHKSKTDRQGQFNFSALPAGQYSVEISARGFKSTMLTLILQNRDRAVIEATMNPGSASQIVEVTEASARVDVVNMSASAFDRLELYDSAKFRAAAPMAMMAMNVPPPPPAVRLVMKSAATGSTSTNAPETHVRSYFPEALYINPEIITDHEGRASISVPLADNITTWRMATVASTSHGALGAGSSSLKVFQDFFVDLDLPVTLTQGDEVSIPVALYNYSGSTGDVALQLEPADWYSLAGDTPDKSVRVESDRVGTSHFTIQANRIGKFKLTLKAQLSGSAKRADIVVREIEVIPNGREQTMVFNGRLESSKVDAEIGFPTDSIPDAHTIFVRLYPGPLSQVIEGMDSILRMPGGCFEQTSSSTYPNILALDYMKRVKKLTPEVHAKAEGYIAKGYQRLLTFEVPGGGFSWFGSAPANKILTAYGLMEFSDMSKVHDVDTRLIERTQQWLASQQQGDGSWQPDQSFINEGATNRFNNDRLRITAYIAWSLETTGFQGTAIEKARQFVETHMRSANSVKVDAYTLAVVANFAVDYAKDRRFTQEAIATLLDTKIEKQDQAWWVSEETGVYSTGQSAAVETTGLAVQALLKSGENPEVARKAINYITAEKSATGNWGTTPATIMALRALLLASEKGGATAKGAVEVLLNGKPIERLTLTSDNNDLLHQFVLKNVEVQGANSVEIRFSGRGSVAYQVAGRYFVPWTEKQANEALSIDVKYDRTHLAQNDIATAMVTVKNNLAQTAKMVMVDLGIPPGFELLPEELQDYQEKTAEKKSGRLEKFSLTATQAILYFDSIAARDAVALKFRLRAKYPIRARTFASRVYEYYDPEVSARAIPVKLEVTGR
jgi:uncharacterized protein YfaS (alpha-2-macroglobulin family)